jgi:anti-anti-sigma factor
MKRHLTTSAVNIGGSSVATVPEALIEPRPSILEPTPEPVPEKAERELVLTSVNTWNHTLILTGELTHRSAQALEVEIERLCEEGVTDITLDLRDLVRIDPVGVAVIAFRCGLCEKRGYGFRLIRGSHAVQRAFEEAGVTSLLPFEDHDAAATQLGAIAHRSLDACER